MRWIKRLLLVFVVVSVVYLFGPSPETPRYVKDWPNVPSLAKLDTWVQERERAVKLRPDNEARIVWANDSLRAKTPYAIVYLHGFSASQEEGDPAHREAAAFVGANLYLARLSEHGKDTAEQLLHLTADSYWESAKEALAIGAMLGDQVILMGTSTGGTQALQLAAAFPDRVAGLVLYSPNIAINDPNAWLLNNPWGLQIARLVLGGKYNHPQDDRPIYKQYWNKPYRLEATVQLQEMLETTMLPETFQAIKQPVLMLYYFQDEAHQDRVVRVDAMLKMFDQLGTPATQKRAVAMPKTGDHVMASPIKSGDVDGVIRETKRFFQEIMAIRK
jgi:pimeloyl-ACP methyl ester carboxylesterase